MATTYSLKRKLFAGTAAQIQTAQGLLVDQNGKTIKGMGSAKKTLNQNIKKYDASKKEIFKQYEKYKKGLTGEALEKANFSDWARNEGKQYLESAQSARKTTLGTVNNIGAVRGKNVNNIANWNGAYNMGAKSTGILGGIKNTWAKAGMGGKAGMVAGGLALGGLAIKGATSLGKKNNQ